MRLRLFIAIIAASVLTGVAQTTTWFPYPTAPETLPIGRPRANYIVAHFWDRCPWKQAYTSQKRMEETIRDFADYIPHASADTVFMSINELIKHTSKRPQDLAALLRMAEATFNSDTAYAYSDRVFLPFAQAGAKAKKLAPAEKEHYAHMAKVLDATSEGRTLPRAMATRADGTKFAINDTTPGVGAYIYFLEEPDDLASRMDRVMLSANVSLNRLIDAGLVKPMLLYVGTPDQSWWDSVSSLKGWTVAAMPDAGQYFDLRRKPAIYMTDNKMEVISKFIPTSLLIANCEQLVKTLNR